MTELSVRERYSISKARVSGMVDLYQSGLTLQEIADRYDVTRESIRYAMKKYFGVTATDGGQHVIAMRNREARAAKIDALYKEKYGCNTREEYRALCKRGAVKKFTQQKVGARARGIGWQLTLVEWWGIWQQSGKWSQRGRGKYVMCRIGDVGPYAKHNVFIATSSLNVVYGHALRRAAKRAA